MEYDYSFRGRVDESSKLYRAYSMAMDVRKFEIELYWKRAAYFWTFIGVSIGGYLAVLTSTPALPAKIDKSDVLFSIAAIGFVFSIAWYLVNRGSKYWQRNWEYQVDILENKALGPLYKTVFHDRSNAMWRPIDAYPFSVSAINILLSLFVVALFVLLAVVAMPCWTPAPTCGPSAPKIAVGTLCSAFAILLFVFGRTARARRGLPNKNAPTDGGLESAQHLVRRVEVK